MFGLGAGRLHSQLTKYWLISWQNAAGGQCLSGPRRKNDKWQWKCKVPTHKLWYANLFQIAGTGKRKGSWCKACTGGSWVNRRKTSFAKNKELADKLAGERGGRCLSGPRRKHDKWRWKCSNAEHSVWQATLCQIQGTGKKNRIVVPTMRGAERAQKGLPSVGETLWGQSP